MFRIRKIHLLDDEELRRFAPVAWRKGVLKHLCQGLIHEQHNRPEALGLLLKETTHG
ncbi:hypothetical protein [Polaromonas sp.]|uniref:hypothetical protein n=1 Tax=Polaromonas sp. TaxID=1869339 RepID=UPI002FC9D985